MSSPQDGTDADNMASTPSRSLPPRPDPRTGRPRPPHAPGYQGPPAGERDEAHKPAPPHGAGPVLAWAQERRFAHVGRYFGALAILVVITSGIVLVFGGKVDILTHWQTWLIFVVFAYLMSNPLSSTTLSAGADWVQWTNNHRYLFLFRLRPTTLATYELTRVVGYQSRWGGQQLRLRDRHGQEFSSSLKRLQLDRDAWDLVYNGIVHSIANGAEINHDVVNMLKLVDSPALTQHRANNGRIF